MFSPKMNSSVIFVTKTHILIGRCPRIRVSRTSFKLISDTPDTLCSVKPEFGSLSGHPAAMYGLATVTYAPVSTVTWHGF
jgi:hypothetical protein